MEGMRKIALSKFLQPEVPQFLDHVVRITKKHNPEELHLKETLDLLIQQQANAAQLKWPYGAHPLTVSLNHLHAKRLSYAALINTKLRMIDKAHFYEMQQSVMIARPTVRFYLSYLGQKNSTTVNMSIKGFFLHLKKEPAIENALIDLGMKAYLDELQKANIEHNKIWMERHGDISKRPNVDSLQVEREVKKILRFFFEQIDSYHSAYKHLDYGPLISELNGVLKNYSRLINLRTTINKRRRTKKTEVEGNKVDNFDKVSAKEKKSEIMPMTDATTVKEPKSVTISNQDTPPVQDKKKKQDGAIHNLIKILKPSAKGKNLT